VPLLVAGRARPRWPNEPERKRRKENAMPSRRLYVEFLEARFLPSTYYLHQGDDLQKTINAAHPGDYLLLDPGATFLGPITLNAKANPDNQWITIETNNSPLPYGTRVGPSDAFSMASILAPSNGPAIQTQPGTNFYYLRALHILPVSAAPMDTL